MKVVKILEDVAFDVKKPVITVVSDDEYGKEIRIAIDEGVEMREHKTPYPIRIVVLEGEILFSVKEEEVKLGRGDMVRLEGNVAHALSAKEKSIILLALHKSDSQKRVFSLV